MLHRKKLLVLLAQIQEKRMILLYHQFTSSKAKLFKLWLDTFLLYDTDLTLIYPIPLINTSHNINFLSWSTSTYVFQSLKVKFFLFNSKLNDNCVCMTNFTGRIMCVKQNIFEIILHTCKYMVTVNRIIIF